MIRDTRKDEQYFRRYLDEQSRRVQAKEEKASACGNDKAKLERVNRSLLTLKMDLLVAEYSAGADRITVTERLSSANRTACAVKTIDYETALRILSLQVMVGDRDGTVALNSAHGSFLESDKLLHCLTTYSLSGETVWHGVFLIPEIYAPLDAVFSDCELTQKQRALSTYLSGWYATCGECAWYDTVDNKNDVYCGYWCFESGAIAKMMSLDSDVLELNEFFPPL